VIRHRCDDAICSASPATEYLEQIGVFVRVDSKELLGRGHDVQLNDVIDAWRAMSKIWDQTRVRCIYPDRIEDR